jgi:diguanylate cyclase (GGDEF)-like protein
LDRRTARWKPILFFALLAGLALSFFVLYISHQTRIKSARSESIVQIQSAVMSAFEVYGHVAEMAFDQTLRKPEVREMILKAETSATPWEREAWKKAVAERIGPFFSQLGYYRIRTLDVIAPDGTFLLRMNETGKTKPGTPSASDLQGPALKERRPVQGFQPGEFFSLYRYSFPLFMGNAFLGSAEFGLTSAAIADHLKTQFPGHYTLLLRKDVLDPLIAPETRRNYVASELSGNFYEDLQVRNLPTPLGDPDPGTLSQIAGKIRHEAAEAMEKGQSFCLFTQVDSRPYAVTFARVESPSGKPIGYIAAVNRNARAVDIQQVSLTVAILLAGLFFLAAAFLRQAIRHHERLVEEALYDSLTGGLKQGRFDGISDRETSMANRYGLPVSLIIFDLDYFKKINDNYGHLKGDAVLRAIGKTVNAHIRRVDYFFRWGGDEFLIVLPNTGVEGALCAAEKIRGLIGQLKPEGIGGLSISAGVAQLGEGDPDLRAVLKRADEALYRAKEKGRNNVSV